MISEDLRFEGFDGDSWLNLLSLFGAGKPEQEGPGSGTLVVVLDRDGQPCAAMLTDRGAVEIDGWEGAAQLQALCERHGVARAIVLDQGTIEELSERAAEAIPLTGDYVSQWLAIWGAARELEDEGKLMYWPPRTRVPLPSSQMVHRAVDLLLPDEHSALLAIWEGEQLWTALALRRRTGDIDRIVGPDLLLDWAGPLSGDHRRDHRQLQRAVTRALGPLHLGLFSTRRELEQLLSTREPGAWARAVALRDVMISPSPPYVHVAVGADAARAAGSRARSFLGGLDLLSYLTPAARFAREHIAHVGSVTNILGFNPLDALAARRDERRREREERDEDGE